MGQLIGTPSVQVYINSLPLNWNCIHIYFLSPTSPTTANILNMPNQILKSALITAVKAGSTKTPLSVEYATKTATWERVMLAQSVQDDFVKHVEKTEVPAGATKVILA